METTTFRPLLHSPGPFTSVYFEDSHDTEDAGKQLELKWRDLRDRLSEQHAPVAALDALENAVLDSAPPVGRSGRGLLATRDSVVLDERLHEAPAEPLTRVSALPFILPLIRYAEPGVRYVVASVDQVSASVVAYDEHGRKRDEEEVRQARNAADIAEDIRKVADRYGAELVVLAGEIQGRRAVYDALPKHLKEIAREVTHQDVAAELALTMRQRRLDDVLDRFGAGLGGETGLAAQGLEAVTAALLEGNVETLLVSDPGEEMVWTSESPEHIAVTEPELRAFGAAEAHERRADEAIPAAAIAVGADVVHVDSSLEAGFGAILRHR